MHKFYTQFCNLISFPMVASREILENRRNPIAAKRLKTSLSRGFSILGFIQWQMARKGESFDTFARDMTIRSTKGMGIIPLCFKSGEVVHTFGFTGHGRYRSHPVICSLGICPEIPSEVL